MTPEEKARQLIDARLEQSGWIVQDLSHVNPMASLGVAVRESKRLEGRHHHHPSDGRCGMDCHQAHP